jgi:hypothetical protein
MALPKNELSGNSTVGARESIGLNSTKILALKDFSSEDLRERVPSRSNVGWIHASNTQPHESPQILPLKVNSESI